MTLLIVGDYWQATHHLLPDGVVGRLQVAQHLSDDLLGVAAVTHGVEKVGRPLTDTDVPLSLHTRRTRMDGWME